MQAVSFRCAAAMALVLFSQLANADFLEDANEKLSLNLFQNRVRVELSGTFDLETYFIEQPPPGLLFTDDTFLVNPRLTLFLDTQIGSYVSTFVQARKCGWTNTPFVFRH